jgi:tetratricopeptide (TPR) repeat protein
MKIRIPAAGLALALAVSVSFWACQSKEVTSAKVYIQQGDWDKAIEQLELAVQSYPEDPEAHYLLGRGYGEKGKFKEMNEEFDKSLALSPKFADRIRVTREKYWVDNFNRGVRFIQAEELEKAEQAFQTAIVLDPSKPEAYKNLAYTYIRMNNVDSAIATYQKLLETTPDDVEAMISLGNLYYNKAEYEKAVETLQKVLEIDPDNVDAIANIALAYDFLGQRDRAIQFYQDAIEKNPEDKDLRFNYGRLFFLAEDYDKAIEQFEKVLEQDPNDLEATLNIANAYLTMAEAKMKILRDLDINQKEYTEKQIEAIRDEAVGFYKQAIPYLEKASELDPNNYATWYNLGVAYANAGEREKAEAAFKKAEELEGDTDSNGANNNQ